MEQKRKFEKKYCDQAKYFTQSFNTDLQQQAILSVKNIINSIHNKALEKWLEKQAASTIDSLLQEMKARLKKIVFDQKKRKEPITKEQFETEIIKISKVTKKNIKTKFFRAVNEMKEEAVGEFGELVNRFNKAEDYNASEQQEEEKKGGEGGSTARNFNILKKNPPCFANNDIVLSDIEKDDFADFHLWAIPNLEKLDACVRYFVEHHDDQFAVDNEGLIEEENDVKDKIEALKSN